MKVTYPDVCCLLIDYHTTGSLLRHANIYFSQNMKVDEMDLIGRLHAVTREAQQKDDLPDFLAKRIFALADLLQDSHDLRVEIEALIEQISLYDTYGQTGYIGMGVNDTILEGTLRRLEEKLENSPP